MDPPTIAPACAAAERRHLGVWSDCAAERKCLAPAATSHRTLGSGVRSAHEEKLRAAASSSMIISFTSTAFIYHMYSQYYILE